jgi:thiamine biosynthesis protein ThiS
MQITLNGNAHICGDGTSVALLVEELKIDPRKVAIEHNLCIVPASEYTDTYLAEGDVLEVVQFIGGG